MSGTLQNPRRTTRTAAESRPVVTPRVAIVARRFWPLAGEAEQDVLRFAESLQQSGARPTIITPRWQKNWAEQTSLRGIPLVRLPWPATPGWGLLRYLYSLSRYLRRNREAFDAVVVQGLRGEAFSALASLPTDSPPVILRATEAGPYGEIAWQRQARFGRRIASRCQQAAAIVTSSAFVAAELRAANYSPEQIHVVPALIERDLTARNEEIRESARHAVAHVNHDLHVVGGAPVAVCISPLQRERGLEFLIRSWLPIQLRWPHARLWIIGDGPERETLYRLICDLDLRYRVVIPGAFDHWDDLLQAADIFVAPAPQPSSSLVLQQALAAGVAVVATDQLEHRSFITGEHNGLLYSTADRSSLTQAVSRLIENHDLAANLGQAARESATRDIRSSEAQWLGSWLAARQSTA